jgi:hypothetical protein
VSRATCAFSIPNWNGRGFLKFFLVSFSFFINNRSISIMLREESYFKRTRKGNVVKVVNQIYLRNDIPCSSQVCKPCEQLKEPVLSATPKATSSLKPHYLVPDTNVFISQVRERDLVERKGR